MMKKKRKSNLIPKLRFSEFQDKTGWEEKVLNAICDVNPSHDGLPDSFVYIDLESVEQGKLVSHNVINREGAPSRAQRLLRKRDVIYQTVRPYQRNNLFFDAEDGRNYVASTGYAQLRAHDSPAFLFQLLHTNAFVNRVLAKCTGSNYPAINSSDLASIEVAVPFPYEQQKIADCLSSLDNLITAEADHLDALKAHKKGLMQQLFPREGETTPRLRFPEFRGKGEWEAKSIGQLGKVVTGCTPSTAIPEYYGGDRLFVSPADISDDRFIEKTNTTLTALGFKETRPIKANSILFVCIGSTIGKIAQNRYECATNQQINSLIPNANNSDGFVYYALSGIADKIANLAGKQAVPIVNKSLFSSVELAVPKLLEQKRIADCLNSLDTQIEAQAAKIESLKQHKRGLMQQLFPAPEAS